MIYTVVPNTPTEEMISEAMRVIKQSGMPTSILSVKDAYRAMLAVAATYDLPQRKEIQK